VALPWTVAAMLDPYLQQKCAEYNPSLRDRGASIPEPMEKALKERKRHPKIVFDFRFIFV
jgi:hypothetical protein